MFYIYSTERREELVSLLSWGLYDQQNLGRMQSLQIHDRS